MWVFKRYYMYIFFCCPFFFFFWKTYLRGQKDLAVICHNGNFLFLVYMSSSIDLVLITFVFADKQWQPDFSVMKSLVMETDFLFTVLFSFFIIYYLDGGSYDWYYELLYCWNLSMCILLWSGGNNNKNVFRCF